MVDFQHLPGQAHIPVILFQNFSHEMVQVYNLDIAGKMIKIGYYSLIFPKEYIVLIKLSVAKTSL